MTSPLPALGVARPAVATPYAAAVTARLRDFLAEAGVHVAGSAPVLTAGQVTMWASLRRVGSPAVGPGHSLLGSDPQAPQRDPA